MGVSLRPWEELSERILSWLSAQELIKRGAESEIRLGPFMGMPAIFKHRVLKSYMHPKLARALASQRTVREAKIISYAASRSVPAPLLYAVFPSISLIVMEYIPGKTLKEAENKVELSREAGRIIALLHEMGIAHGDPTTSNFIFSEGRLRIIDFGLSEMTSDIEDFAVDLHLFRRAVESTHAAIAKEMYEAFLAGYAEIRSVEQVARRAEEIRMRGRYVEERRSVWGRL